MLAEGFAQPKSLSDRCPTVAQLARKRSDGLSAASCAGAYNSLRAETRWPGKPTPKSLANGKVPPKSTDSAIRLLRDALLVHREWFRHLWTQ